MPVGNGNCSVVHVLCSLCHARVVISPPRSSKKAGKAVVNGPSVGVEEGREEAEEEEEEEEEGGSEEGGDTGTTQPSTAAVKGKPVLKKGVLPRGTRRGGGGPKGKKSSL